MPIHVHHRRTFIKSINLLRGLQLIKLPLQQLKSRHIFTSHLKARLMKYLSYFGHAVWPILASTCLLARQYSTLLFI